MGCNQSAVKVQEPTSKAKYMKAEPHGLGSCYAVMVSEQMKANTVNSLEEKLMELQKSRLQIEERCEVECKPPQGQRDYNSFEHQLDSFDRQALADGLPLPVNGYADRKLAIRMNDELSQFLEDPGTLQRSINMKRMNLEDVENFCAMSSLGGVTEQEDVKVARPSSSPPMLPNGGKQRSVVMNL